VSCPTLTKKKNEPVDAHDKIMSKEIEEFTSNKTKPTTPKPKPTIATGPRDSPNNKDAKTATVNGCESMITCPISHLNPTQKFMSVCHYLLQKNSVAKSSSQYSATVCRLESIEKCAISLQERKSLHGKRDGGIEKEKIIFKY